MKQYAFGVDVGGTFCKLGLFETNGNLIDKWAIPTNTENNGAAILPDVADEINKKLKAAGIDEDDVLGIGIGVPGPVTGHRTVSVCENLGWENVNVAAELKELTGLHVMVENDANMATLGEMWKGTAAGCKNVVLFTLGTGIGAGIVADGKIVTGVCGAAGEIGHITVNFEEQEQCSCGKYGCLEQYGSATGIVRLAKRKLAACTEATVLYQADSLTAKTVLDAAKAGDATALAVVEEVGRLIGFAMANVACVTNPEVFVVGGGVSKAGSILTDVIKKYFDKYTFTDCRCAKFVLASLGNDAGMYGCVKLLLG